MKTNSNKGKDNKKNKKKQISKSNSRNKRVTIKEPKKKKKIKKEKLYTEEELEQIAKKRKLIASIFKKIFIFAIVVTAIVLFMMSPLFSITDIEVQENDKIT